MALLNYWQEFPPVHVLLQSIATGLSGKKIGRANPVNEPEPKNIQSAEELIGIITGSGISGGVIEKAVSHGG
jgi:hypothetical protein